MRRQFRFAFTIATIMTITIGTIAKTAPIGVIWSSNTGITASTTGSTTTCKVTIGNGATIIQTATNEDSGLAKGTALQGRPVATNFGSSIEEGRDGFPEDSTSLHESG